MFKWVKNTVRKSEAAVLVQQALQAHTGFGPPPFNADTLSTRLVALIWDRKPDLFEGKLGKQPHKMAIAAFALAVGTNEFPDGSEAQLAVHLALGAVLLDLVTNGPLYDLGGPDRWLMDRADEAYCAVSEQNRPAQDALLGSLGM